MVICLTPSLLVSPSKYSQCETRPPHPPFPHTSLTLELCAQSSGTFSAVNIIQLDFENVLSPFPAGEGKGYAPPIVGRKVQFDLYKYKLIQIYPEEKNSHLTYSLFTLTYYLNYITPSADCQRVLSGMGDFPVAVEEEIYIKFPPNARILPQKQKF